MLRMMVLLSLISMVQDSPPIIVDPEPDQKSKVGIAESQALAKYNVMRADVADSATAHWKLALWCEQNGLRPEASFHFGKVIELDPKRDAAWQKLGFKKNDGRWMTPEQILAEDELKKSEKVWLAQLKKCHKEIHGGKKQADAQATLDAITDPSAVSSIYREFGGGGARDQEIAVQLLGQIESPVASKVLALLAVYGKTPNVRRLATETLRGRKADEFLDFLVALMKDTLQYEVRPVGGPGSPGVLFVEGEKFNVRRFYAPPPLPNVSPRPGDIITYDAMGMPLITRNTPIGVSQKGGVPGSKTLVNERNFVTSETYSYSQAIAEAQRGAANAKAQLASDVAEIDAINGQRSTFNDLVMNVAKDATGKSLGKSPKEWRKALETGNGPDTQKTPSREHPIPTIDELIPRRSTTPRHSPRSFPSSPGRSSIPDPSSTDRFPVGNLRPSDRPGDDRRIKPSSTHHRTAPPVLLEPRN